MRPDWIFSSYLIYLATALAFIFPEVASSLEKALGFLLILMMSHSLTKLKVRGIGLGEVAEGLRLTLFHFLGLSTLLLVAMLLVGPGFRQGFMVLAVVPPAISIVVLSRLSNGRVQDSFMGLLMSYLFAFIYAPAVLHIFQGESISPFIILKPLVLYTFVPFVISRALARASFLNEKRNHLIVNSLFALLFFIIIGSRSEYILNNLRDLWVIVVIMAMLSFGLGTVIFLLRPKSLEYVFFGTYKNTSMAMVIAMTYFGPLAIVPISIRALLSPLFTIYILFLNGLTRKSRRKTLGD
ncbi:MAG: hypothetical protein KJ709_01180 [Nanoarchaeota archaeon]|nr:hypothetical protein [Nanoarchaeota archaeon]